jgi:hypothetical protein
MRKTLAFLSLVLLLFMVSGADAQMARRNRGGGAAPAAARFGNVEGITAKQLRDYLTFIASDELEGRDTPSRGLDIAAMYIAQHLASWGIKPAGDNGTYFQKFPLKRSRIKAQETRLEFNGISYSYGHDLLSSMTPSSVPASNLVFAGNGWVIKSKNIDPYQGIDVRDKVVIVVNSLPKGVTFADLKGKPGEDWSSPPLYAQNHGARAVIAFANFGGLASWEAIRWGQTEKGVVEFGVPENKITVPTVTVTPKVLAALFQGEKASASSLFTKTIMGDALESFDLKPEKRVSLNVALASETVYTQNVVGVLEGSDTVLKNEYVAVGAHYDHVGMNPFWAGEDKIWNGADDDGSGTVSVMAIAEAMSKGTRPKRSILFIWHAGEEKGLWGSEYFTNNPTVPIGNVIAELNIDMIGRYQNPGDENHPQNKNLPKQGEVFVIGSKMMSTELGDTSEAVNKAYLNLSLNYKYDDPNDPEQFFFRSDHFNYAKKGVPIIFYMDGSHADYHQPSDSIEKINFEQMERVARTIMATGWELANRPVRPKVDKPLPASAMQN